MTDDAETGFLRGLTPAASETVHWPGNLSFTVHTYLTANTPPHSLLTSARAVVLREGEVLAITDRSPSTHIMPGGRIRPGEDARAAAMREAGEESGWEVETGRQIGVRHLRHLQARPEGYEFPYPDFFQVVFVARAVRYRPELRDVDGWETDARFIPTGDAGTLRLSAGEQILLAAALEAIHQPSDTASG